MAVCLNGYGNMLMKKSLCNNGHGIKPLKNGHGINGYGINGHGINGHGINGHGINGHGINGHGINGHGRNGHGRNGRRNNGGGKVVREKYGHIGYI